MLMPFRGDPRARFFTLVVAAAIAAGCSGSGTGCTTLTPLPGRYVGAKNDNAVNVRLSANGINYLNANWRTLIGLFAPGASLSITIPCAPISTPVGDVAIADTGSAFCNDSSCGRLDGQCTSADVGSTVTATITGFALVPHPPDSLDATLQLQINTSDIPLASKSSNFALCIGLSRFECAVRFNTASTGPSDNRLKATVKFTIDNTWDKLLGFQVTALKGIDVCGASGAPPAPDCLQPGDISLNGQNTCGTVYCGLADLDIVKTALLQLVASPLQTQITALVAGQSCESCGSAGQLSCPTAANGTTSSCVAGRCVGPNGACVPRFLGTEGRLNLASLLGSFGAPADAQLDLSVAAGSSVLFDQGLSLGTRVGLKPVTVAGCVVPVDPPPMEPLTAPDFDREATPGSGYHVGLGLSANFLNAAFWAAQQSGALCLQLTSQSTTLISTGLFKTFLPSLGKLATRDGKDAPMLIALRPARPPTVSIGQGTYDPVTKKPIKPLLTVIWPDLNIDFYAQFDDRQARLFTLTADLQLPLSLIFEGCDTVTPALGDFKMLISNVRHSNSEMLAEDPQVLGDLLPAVVGLAEPAVAKALTGFALPSLGSFKLKVNETKGLSAIAGTEAYNHLGLYATLLPTNAMCATASPKFAATLKGQHLPQAKSMRLDGRHALPIPEAVFEVHALGKSGTAEFSTRVDHGLWTEFATVQGDTLTVAHPRFLIQGQHTIELRTRVSEDPHGVSPPTTVGFMVDWDAPELSLTADSAHDRLIVEAHDVISPSERLRFAYRVGTGALSEFGPAREISLSAIEQQGGVTVQVQDELGNLAEAVYRVPTISEHPDTPTGATPSSDQGNAAAGCSTTAGGELLVLAALALARRRKQ